MKYKYGFVVDSGSTYNLPAKDNIWKVPIIVNVDNNGDIKSYEEGVNIDTTTIINYLNEGYSLSTSQPNLEHTKSVIEEALNQCETLIVIPLSKGLSGFNEVLMNEYKNNKRVIVIDSKCVSILGNWYVSDLIELIDNNKIDLTDSAINKFFYEKYNKSCGVCILTNLKQLIKGGRLKGFKKIIAQLFKLKLTVRFDGELNLWDKNMSLDAAIAKSIRLIDSKINFTKNGIKRITLLNQLTNQDLGNKIIDKVKKILKVETYTPAELPGAIVAHVGDDTFSLYIETY